MFSRDTSQVSGVVFSLNEAVHSSLKIVGTQLKNHGIEVVLDLADDLPEVEGFPHQMDQVFLNLLANARDALDERTGGWKRIEIRTRPKDGRVIGEVTDNGPGMDVAVADQVFEPFFTTKTAEHGTGLGLSISYAIVRNHGGEMICESRKGKGTMFQVSLPVIRNDS
jgi:histidine kinase